MTTATLAAEAPVAAPPALDFDTRLALRDAVMTGRLEWARLTHDVNAALAETVVDLGDVVTVPVEAPTPALAPEATPVAALLERARLRILRDGWCRDAASDVTGGMCLTEALRVEARSHAEEGEARILLRRALGGGDSVPEQNRRLANATAAAGVLASAANAAAQQGI